MTDRAVSVTLDYIIMLMIATVVLAGVASVAGTLINDQVDRGIEGELEVTGESLAADIQDVERLVNTSGSGSVQLDLETRLPDHVSGERYTIDIGTDGTIVLSTENPDVEVTVEVASGLLESTSDSLTGGPMNLTADENSIVVTEA